MLAVFGTHLAEKEDLAIAALSASLSCSARILTSSRFGILNTSFSSLQSDRSFRAFMGMELCHFQLKKVT